MHGFEAAIGLYPTYVVRYPDVTTWSLKRDRNSAVNRSPILWAMHALNAATFAASGIAAQ
jgi:hypothetical protein